MIIFLILILLASPAHAQEFYVYKPVKITDGDTIKLDVSKESPLIKKLGLSVRIKGIDTPEKGSKAKCDKENVLGQQATKFTNDLVGNKELLLSEVKNDKYGGRIVANVEMAPEFQGGQTALGKFLGSRLRYPAGARQNKIQGKVYIGFIVEKNGSLTDFKVVRGIGGGCDEEAIRVLRSSPVWRPGMANGKPVRTSYVLPITFQPGN